MFYFINGQFWQEEELPQLRDGILALAVRETQALFHGFIDEGRVENVCGDPIDGRMNDVFGNSSITEFKLSELSLTFMKKYSGDGRAPVSYRLARSVGNAIGNHFFAGTWTIGIEDHIIATGKARCVLTEIPDHFWNKPA